MRNTSTSSFAAAILLIALNLFNLPSTTHSFTAQQITRHPPATTTPASVRSSAAFRRSPATNLHGLPLPGFPTETKATDGTATQERLLDIPVPPGEGGAVSTEMMELSLETTTAAAEKEEPLSETQTLLQKVKQAGTAGGKCFLFIETDKN